MHWHIILTEKCNLRCKYCYEKSMNEFENGLEKKWSYDNDVPCDSEVSIEKIKNFLAKDDNPTLIFYGGEPLVKMERMMKIMDKVPVRFCIQTNGVLLDKIPEEYLIKFSKILVSIDGGRVANDFNRGEGRYDQIVSNVRKIRDKGFSNEVVARMTISKEFPDVINQVQHLFNLELFDSVHFQIDAGFYKNDFDKIEFGKFVKEYNYSVGKLVDWWVSEMREGRVRKIYPFLGIYDSLVSGEDCGLPCGSGHSNYTITINGKLSACPIMNSVENFYCGDLDSEMKDIKKITCGGKCEGCEYKKVCGGRCLYSNHARLWPEEGADMICETIKHLIDKIEEKGSEILELIEEGVIKKKDFDFEKYFGPEIVP